MPKPTGIKSLGVRDATHKAIRLRAAELGVSMTELVDRIWYESGSDTMTQVKSTEDSQLPPTSAAAPEEQEWIDRLLRLFRTGHPEVVATLKKLMQTLESTSNGYSERNEGSRIRDNKPSGGRDSGRAT